MIKKALRWIFFGELEAGLEMAVVFYSTVIAFVSYFFGYEIWALMLNGRRNSDATAIAYQIALVFFAAVFTLFVLRLKFQATPASAVSLGVMLLFLCGTFPPELSTLGIGLASCLFIVRGFSAGPAHEQQLT